MDGAAASTVQGSTAGDNTRKTSWENAWQRSDSYACSRWIMVGSLHTAATKRSSDNSAGTVSNRLISVPGRDSKVFAT